MVDLRNQRAALKGKPLQPKVPVGIQAYNWETPGGDLGDVLVECCAEGIRSSIAPRLNGCVTGEDGDVVHPALDANAGDATATGGRWREELPRKVLMRMLQPACTLVNLPLPMDQCQAV